jgi:hypothetical protein
VYSGESELIFRRKISPPISGMKNKQCDTPCCLLHVGFLLGLLISPKSRGDVPPKCQLILPDYMTLYPRR